MRKPNKKKAKLGRRAPPPKVVKRKPLSQKPRRTKGGRYEGHALIEKKSGRIVLSSIRADVAGVEFLREYVNAVTAYRIGKVEVREI